MRSHFLMLSCVLACAALGISISAQGGDQTGIGPSFKGPVGLQLYSLRDQFKQDVAGTLDKVKAFGFRNAELAGTYGMKPEEFKSALEARGITGIAAHFPFEQYKTDPEGIIREAKALGLRYAGCAWIPHTGAFDEKQCREAAEVFNRAGERLAANGIRFFYHVHGYEFQPFGKGNLFDLLMEQTNPKFVAYEMDVFWVVHPGQDPVKLLKKYGKRWELMHIKDMRKGTQTGLLTGSSDVKNDVALGEGQIPMGAVLKAAKKAGTKWYFIEDESPSVESQIPISLRYLETVRF